MDPVSVADLRLQFDLRKLAVKLGEQSRNKIAANGETSTHGKPALFKPTIFLDRTCRVYFQ